jgi:hypothetical protein
MMEVDEKAYVDHFYRLLTMAHLCLYFDIDLSCFGLLFLTFNLDFTDAQKNRPKTVANHTL